MKTFDNRHRLQKRSDTLIGFGGWAIGFLWLLLVGTSNAWAIERRQDQSPRESGYFIIPYAMQMPGIGSWIGAAAGMDNLFGLETDAYLATMLGDLNGYVTAVTDIPLGTEHLIVNYFQSRFTRGSVQTYDRGIDSDPDNYRLVIADKINYDLVMIALKFWEKRLQLYTSAGRSAFRLDSLLDADGNELAKVDQEEHEGEDRDIGLIIDYTDDRQDPRTGVRLEARRKESPRRDETSSQYYVDESSLSFYLPIGQRNTWVFNAFKADAVVTDEGITDEQQIRQSIGVDCRFAPPDLQAECEATVKRQVDQVVAHNKHGTASYLGGTQNMRSFPQGRFYAAHSLFYGTEFRWNITDEFSPFDIVLAKGVRTNIQLAFFAEQATLADRPEDLGNKWVHSYGAGVRMVMASGFVFRLDGATGEEGFQTQLFLNYPWGLFN
jgi:hypothetical protein